MPDQLIPYSIFSRSTDNWGKPFHSAWSQISVSLATHYEGEKDGWALTCATFTGARGNVNLAERGLIALDIETSKVTGAVPPPPADIVPLLAAKRLAGVIWSTHSHKPQEPRWRLILPLSRPLSCPEIGEVDPFLSWVVAAQLGLEDVADHGKFGAASLMYTARHPTGTDTHWSAVCQGDPIDADELLAVATMAADKVAMDDAQERALRKTQEMPPEILAVMEAYNETHPLGDMFSRYGFQRQRNRWKSRYQSAASTGATSILPDNKTWVSFSESDADAGMGHRPSKRTSQCSCFGDSFSLFVHYECRGSFRDALTRAKVMPGEAL